MIFKIVKPTDINIKYLEVYFGGRFYPEDLCINNESFEELNELFIKYPSLKAINPDGYEDVYLKIDVATGKVINFPSLNIDCYLQDIKIVDEGIYVLVGDNDEQLCVHRDYVPKCLEIDGEGWGDYFEFTIDKNGVIKNWEFTQNDVNEMLVCKDKFD